MNQKSEPKIFILKIWKFEMKFQNLPYKIALLLTWAAVGVLIILALGVSYSFIKGWSTIKIERKHPDKNHTLKIDDLEQNVPPGTPVTIIKDGKKVEIRKGNTE